ncbi:LacI family DNA-binding transcriptional regulator [Terriglobus roseus]|uniref:Transcriptional regulator, LacI family n=1 Tax=Terriglobus roseus TaxID=392734 RepID=A0A1H4JAW9_9BACT|nr:LacI family DNA-binding transcriptional regulator [Terriglobus roseus]SEB43297.1 transcriptional regulator, LacI family [Terriglobus roseus]
MKIRLQDIADDLKLSKMTISRVLRGHVDVSADTKALVLKRMQELNYRPNISARSLRTGQAYLVGLVVRDLRDPHVADVCRGLNRVFRAASYGLVVSSTDDDPEGEEREAELHLSRQVDALFLFGNDGSPDAPEALRNSHVPIVYLGRKPATLPAWSVGLREIEVGKAAAEHLFARSACRIAYLRGPRTFAADQRFSGYLEAHRDAGIAPRQELAIEPRHGGSEYESAFGAVRGMLQGRMAPDGVMAYTDALAAGARDAALGRGLRVPEDFQVIGCGNNLQVCSIGPALSSVDLAGEEIGTKAGRLALKAIENGANDKPRSLTVSPRVIARATTRSTTTAGREKKG